jgi:hypothetical protein
MAFVSQTFHNLKAMIKCRIMFKSCEMAFVSQTFHNLKAMIKCDKKIIKSLCDCEMIVR